MISLKLINISSYTVANFTFLILPLLFLPLTPRLFVPLLFLLFLLLVSFLPLLLLLLELYHISALVHVALTLDHVSCCYILGVARSLFLFHFLTFDLSSSCSFLPLLVFSVLFILALVLVLSSFSEDYVTGGTFRRHC